MKKMKKLFAVILSLAMVLGMTMTSFAATNTNVNGNSQDRVEVSIAGLTGNPKVTLYQIAKGDYDSDDGKAENVFKGYTWASGITEEMKEDAKVAPGLSSTQITAIVNGINGKKDFTPVVPFDTVGPEKVNGDTFKKTVAAGAYIAVITEATDGSVYNPILLTASYNEKGALEGGEITAAVTTMYGSESVAKKTEPDVKKEITGGTTPDPTIPEGKDKYTASVGDVLQYAITPIIPSYPANAMNKTLFVSDVMSEGLTFDASSLVINIDETDVKQDSNANTFSYNNETIATVDTTSVTNGFYLNFDYEKILEENGKPYDIVVKYSARVNENAVVGEGRVLTCELEEGAGHTHGKECYSEGNYNDAKMYYANDPTKGSTFTPDDTHKTPDGAEGVTKKEDEKSVYTYQLSFKKTNNDETKVLENAIFGIYTDEDCTKLFDIVKTNKAGYAVSTSVAAGDYWIREIAAPDGYSLSDKIIPVHVDWKSATKTITRTETTTRTKYTTEEDKAATQPPVSVGWIYNSQFYKNKPNDAAEPAYVLSETTTATETTITEPGQAGSGTYELGAPIKNTQLSALPSTGGIGTTIFTIGGCVIMIAAAALFFASRKKSQK